METNYYVRTKPPCPQCGREFERLHIGKSSAGWCFSVHVEPGDPDFPHSWEEWKERLASSGEEIVNEYGEVISLSDLVACVEERYWLGEGHSGEWLRQNGATTGPRGLARFAPGRLWMVGHGSGTWDLISGEFF